MKLIAENGWIHTAIILPSAIKKIQQSKLRKEQNDIKKDAMFTDFDETFNYLKNYKG